MAKTPDAKRALATDGMAFSCATVSIRPAPPASRISLRATDKGAKSFAKSLGFSLPVKPNEVTMRGGRHALWLGPDEWLVYDEAEADLMPRRESAEVSTTDISHRNVAFLVSGGGAADAMNGGCPRDLSVEAFPPGSAARTVFGKAEIVLQRLDADSFRVECWRSFAPYVFDLLRESARTL